MLTVYIVEKVLKKLMDKIKSQRDEWISKSNADLDIPEDASLKVNNQSVKNVYRCIYMVQFFLQICYKIFLCTCFKHRFDILSLLSKILDWYMLILEWSLIGFTFMFTADAQVNF